MRETKKKENIFAKKGFFITLVGLVAVTVIALVMNMILPEEKQNKLDEGAWEDALRQSVAEADTTYQENAVAVNGPALPQDAGQEVEDSDAEETIGNVQEQSTPPQSSSKSLLMEKPVPGSITKDFSPEDLIYSDTMQDWRVHEGVDFAAEEKSEVKAVADGTVESVSQDGLFGACLIISHPDEVKTFYANLEEDSMPTVGTQVKTGQVIGRVGKTATVEINDTPHLHFEVRKDGKPVNPHDFLGDSVTDDE